MRFASYDNFIGNRPILVGFNPADDASPNPLLQANGTILKAADAWWGAAEFMYVRANGAIRNLGLVVVTPTFNSTENRWRYEATEVPNTANLGRTLGVALRALSSGQYGWVCVGGTIPVNCNASVAADTTFGIAAAGQGGANTAGKQILNARVVAAGTTTVAKANCRVTANSPIVSVTNADGWFIGMPISGTGIPASTTVAGIDVSGLSVTLSANATASGSVTVTGTYNDGTIFYNVAHLNRPFAQGAIT